MTLNSIKLSAIILTLSLFISPGNISTLIDKRSNMSEITLHEGWNLISLPFKPEDSSIDVILADILDNVEIIWGYDMGEWSFYLPTLPEKGDLTEMVEDRGYWIKMNIDAILMIYAEGYLLRNPSMLDVYEFIADDKTDENNYTDEYECRHFAAELNKNAFVKGYLCYYVSLEFQEGAHSIVAFKTIDMGLIYVEPQNDDIIEPQIGNSYWNRTNWGTPPYNDTIIDILLIP